jgi:hypothetical protein
MNYAAGEIVEQVRSMQMSADWFSCWGLPILRGRAYNAQDDLPNDPRVVLISQGFWTRRFRCQPADFRRNHFAQR